MRFSHLYEVAFLASISNKEGHIDLEYLAHVIISTLGFFGQTNFQILVGNPNQLMHCGILSTLYNFHLNITKLYHQSRSRFQAYAWIRSPQGHCRYSGFFGPQLVTVVYLLIALTHNKSKTFAFFSDLHLCCAGHANVRDGLHAGELCSGSYSQVIHCCFYYC